MAIAFVETALFISKNSWFQPGLLSRSLKFEFPCNGHIFYSKPIIQIMQSFSVFKFLMDKIILKAERKNFDAWAGSGARNLSFGSTVLVPTSANLVPGFYLQVFQSRLQIGQLKSYGVSTGLIHIKTIAVFITHVQYLVETCSGTYFVGNFSSNIRLTFPKTSGKRSLHLIQTSDHP